MKMGKLKRCLAGFLAVATVLSSSNIAYAAEYNQDKSVYTVKAAEAVAEHYDLTDAEKAVLASNVIAQGDELKANVPTEEQVAVNSDNKTVTATAVSGTAYKWVPSTGKTLTSDGNNTEIDKALTFGTTDGETYTSSAYTASGAFTVQVNYDLQYNVSENEQQRLLGVPDILAEGMQYMVELSDLRGKLGLLEDETESLKEAKNTLEAEVKANLSVKLHAEAENRWSGSKLTIAKAAIDNMLASKDFVTNLLSYELVKDNEELTKTLNDYIAVTEIIDSLIVDIEDGGLNYRNVITVPADTLKLAFLMNADNVSKIKDNNALVDDFDYIVAYINNNNIKDYDDVVEALEY